MNKKYQMLKKKCISLVLFALLVAFLVPYYAYAAGNGAESAAESSVAESAGGFSVFAENSGDNPGESSGEKSITESVVDENEATSGETSEKASVGTSAVSDAEEGTEASGSEAMSSEGSVEENTEGNVEEKSLTKKEIKVFRKNLQLGRSYGFYAWDAEENTVEVQSADDEAGVATQADAEPLNPDVNTVLPTVRSYILSKDTKPDYSSIWNVIGLKRSGLSVPESYTNLFYSNVIAYCESKGWQLTKTKYSDYSKLILALTSIGVDARNVMGHNLLSYLSDYKNVSLQGNNGPIWALIALNSNPSYTIPVNPSAQKQNSEELMITEILGMQCPDGGWSLTKEKGDSDMTGMAIQALSSYYRKRDDVTKAIDNGLAWISKNQFPSGGFGTIGTDPSKTIETSESVAQVITALCGLGIDCGKDSRFIKNRKWPMTGLFQYYMSEGGFMHVAAGAGNNGGGAGGTIDGMATEQGLYATVAYHRLLDGNTFLYDMSDVEIAPGTTPVVSPTIDTGSNNGGSATTTASKKETTKVKVIKVGLNYSTIYLTKGKSKTLKATVSPANATDKSVSWSSSNKKIATVSSKGKVTAKKAGTATITVKAKDGSGKKATCKVVVSAAATATTAKKATTTTAARSQTKRLTTPVPSGTTNRVAGSGTGTSGSSGVASGTTKTLPSGSSSGTGTGSTTAKSATGTTAKKKDTAAEATTGSWNFSGEDYVPDTYAADETDAAEADTTADGEEASSKSDGKGRVALYIAGGVGGLAVVEALGFVVYKKRRSIAGGIAGIVSKLRKGGDAE